MRRAFAAMPVALGALPAADAAAQSAGTLRVVPRTPMPGDTVIVTYTAPLGRFTGAPTLALRGRLRAPDDYVYEYAPRSRVLARLVRGHGRRFVGWFVLPLGAVYASVVVEDTASGAVDANAGCHWDVLAHTRAGMPLGAALYQQSQEHFGEQWPLAYAAARRWAAAYPDSIQAWPNLFYFEATLRDGAALDTLRARHRARLAAFERRWAARGDVGDRAASLWWYARALGDTARAAAWRTRAYAAAPDAFLVVQDRVERWQAEHAKAPATMLALADSLWRALGPRPHLIARRALTEAGVAAALQQQDASALRRWVARAGERPTLQALLTLPALATLPATRPEAVTALRDALAAVDADAGVGRGLGLSAREPSAERTEVVTQLTLALGGALAAEGDTAAGRAVLRAGAGGLRRPSSLRRVGRALLTLGDTAGAVPVWAALALDPGAPAARGDSLRALGVAAAGPARWSAAVDSVRTAAAAARLAEDLQRSLTPVALTDADGRWTTLRAAVQGAPTVVAYWSRFCGNSLAALPDLAAVAARVAALGGRVISLLPEPPSAGRAQFLAARGVQTPVFADRSGSALRTLGLNGTPEYFVLDGAGRLRFAHVALEDTPGLVAALRR